MGTTSRRIYFRPPTYNTPTSKKQKATEITYHTQNKLFTNKGPKAKGHLNIVLKISEIYIKQNHALGRQQGFCRLSEAGGHQRLQLPLESWKQEQEEDWQQAVLR